MSTKTRSKTPPKPRKKMMPPEHARVSEQEFTNREIGWLEFNKRVLNEAMDSRTPLLERVRFLSICSSNIDEFFMKRVGRLKRNIAYGFAPKSADGQTPPEQMQAIRQHATPMMHQMDTIYKNLRVLLAQEGIHLMRWADLNESERAEVKKYYNKNIFPVLTPLSVDPGHPFPFISNLSTSLGVTLRQPGQDETFFARVKVPKVLPQWIKVPGAEGSHRFISLLDTLEQNIGDLFPSMQVVRTMAFRLTRNADVDRDEEGAEDILEYIEEELRQRRFAEVVRLEHGPKPDPWMLKFLMDELELSDEDVYELKGELDYTDLNLIADLPIPKLKYEVYVPGVPIQFMDDGTSVFDLIRKQDFLLHHPYESFRSTVERFVREASMDPKVLAIKMTLYRTGDNSPFIKSLIRAAEQGKQVVCLIELKARFDEERNIFWAQALENAGVHVVYGVVGLKTHAKTTLVVRQEAGELKCYTHIGTGNYNVATSRVYTDLGILTAKEEITNDVVDFFHYLTGRSLKTDYKNLLVAPVNMFSKFKAMIEREGENAKAGKPAHIIAKFNNMEENELGSTLYQASQKGCEVDLIVRGFCSLRPGIPGLSERVRVISIIGRFLEHSRVFYFRNGAADPVDGEFYLGSADWMYRNLHARVEAVVPLLDRSLKEKCWEILQISLKDQRHTWEMNSKGEYNQRKSNEPGVHQQLMSLSKQRAPHREDPSEGKET